MSITIRHTACILAVLATLLTAACGDHKPPSHEYAMRPTMDSLKMWFHEMNGDSMQAKSQRVARYLDRHRNDRSVGTRRLRAEWLKAQGVWYGAIKGQPDSGIIYTEKALDEMKGLEGVDEMRVLAMANRADFYRQRGMLDYSADGYLQVLQTADQCGLGDTMQIPLMLGISTVYTFMGDYLNSGKWFGELKKLLPVMNRGDQFIYYNNLGNDHYFQEHYQQARDCFVQAARLVKDNPQRQWDYYTALANLSEIHVCMMQADSARILLAQVDSFFRRTDFKPVMYYLATTRMELQMLQGNRAGAWQTAAESPTDEVSIPAAKVLRLKALEQLMTQSGRWQQAYQTHRELNQLTDSIQNKNNAMRLSTMLMQYNHQKELSRQQQELDYHRITTWLSLSLLALAVMAVAVLGVAVRSYRHRQRLQELTTRQQIMTLRMENIRGHITPHFIYNALTHEMLQQLKGHEVDLNALTQLLRRGVDQADMLQTTLGEELHFVDYYVEVESRQMAQPLDYRKEVADGIALDQVWLPAMTIQIYVENAIKHGLRRQGGRLTIRANRQQDATLVEVIDNGQGLTAGHPQEHVGLRVVRQTIQMLNEHNSRPISYGVENWQHNGDSGCKSWILLPDGYNYGELRIENREIWTTRN